MLADGNVDSAKTILGLRFSDVADTALNLTNNALTINGSGIAVDAAAAGAHVIGAPIVLGANQNWTNNSSTALTASGVISGSGTLTKKGAGRLTLCLRPMRSRARSWPASLGSRAPRSGSISPRSAPSGL